MKMLIILILILIMIMIKKKNIQTQPHSNHIMSKCSKVIKMEKIKNQKINQMILNVLKMKRM